MIRYFYEFVGTFFLVLTVGMTVLNPNSVGVVAPIAIGAILAVMVYAGAHVSGGHYNPAVSLALFIRGKLSFNDLLGYWVFQLIAAVIAAYLTIYFKGEANPTVSNLGLLKSFLAEFLFTFALCFVVLNVATTAESKGNSYYGFAIGFTVLAGAYAMGAVSSAAFNPAVALGITIMNLVSWSNLWLFFVSNLLGGACAALVFRAQGLSREKLL
jgi:aquaporin Z